jgi:adenosylhomocysteinase
MATPTVTAVTGEVKDLTQADRGKKRIEWAFQSMPILQRVRKHLITTQPFSELRVAACLHITPETANLMITMRDGGAGIFLCAAGLDSTQEDVGACLTRDYSIPVYATPDESAETQQSNIDQALNQAPQLLLDDGGKLIRALHVRHSERAAGVIGAAELSAAAAGRLRREIGLCFPVFSLGDSPAIRLFDSRYGAGQSTLDAVVYTTGLLLSGANVVVAGFGPCGRGIAVRARGLGANVIVTEVDPLRALEANMEGYRVLSMREAAVLGDLFITASGNTNVIARAHYEKFKNNVYLCNAGHSNVEIDIEALGSLAYSRRVARDHVEEFAMRDGRKIYLLADARPVNMVAGEGQPAAVMDVAFAGSALMAEYLVKDCSSLSKTVHPVPPDMDRLVAKLKLEAMSIKIDRLTVEQEQYLANWSEGAVFAGYNKIPEI